MKPTCLVSGCANEPEYDWESGTPFSKCSRCLDLQSALWVRHLHAEPLADMSYNGLNTSYLMSVDSIVEGPSGLSVTLVCSRGFCSESVTTFREATR